MTPTRHLTDDLFSGCTCLCQKKKNQNIHDILYLKSCCLLKRFSRFSLLMNFSKAAAFSWVIHDTFIPISRVESIRTRQRKNRAYFWMPMKWKFFSDSIDFYPSSQCLKLIKNVSSEFWLKGNIAYVSSQEFGPPVPPKYQSRNLS